MATDLDDKKIVLDCTCGSSHHQLTAKIMRWDKNDIEFYIHFQLKQWRNLFGRAKMAFKYFFNQEVPHGHWDTTHVQLADAKNLRDMLNEYINEVEPPPRPTLEQVEAELAGIGPRMSYLIKEKIRLIQEKSSSVIEKRNGENDVVR